MRLERKSIDLLLKPNQNKQKQRVVRATLFYPKLLTISGMKYIAKTVAIVEPRPETAIVAIDIPLIFLFLTP